MSSRNLPSRYIFHKKLDKVLHSCLAAENQMLLKSVGVLSGRASQDFVLWYHF